MVAHLPMLFEQDSPLRALFDAMSAMVFVVDENLVVHDANLSAARALGPDAELVLRRLCGEVLRCMNSGVHGEGEPGPCGETDGCKDCVLRRSTEGAMRLEAAQRRPYVMRLLVGERFRETHFVVSATPFVHDGRRYAMLVLEDVTELADLRRLLPVCAWCKKVYVGGAYQPAVGDAANVRDRSLAEITHGLCTECAAVHFPEEGE